MNEGNWGRREIKEQDSVKGKGRMDLRSAMLNFT
jgi:hypothetical protein